MGTFADYLEAKLLNLTFGKAAYTAETIYIALSTVDPGESGTALAEPGGGSYARITTTTADWDAAALGVIDNAVDLTFPAATGAWGTITHFALMNAETATSEVMGSAALAVSKVVSSGDTVKFAAGDLDVSLD